MRADLTKEFDALAYPRSKSFINLSGRRYGRLIVRGYVGRRGGRAYFVSDCSCGQLTITSGLSLQSGRTQSCGCLHSERSAEKAAHGHSRKEAKTGEYRSWVQMKTRCFNPNYGEFHYYGGRGITVCDRWRACFENFLADMGPRPSPKHSIDRYPNPDGNYEPGNCRWATPREQANNRRSAAK